MQSLCVAASAKDEVTRLRPIFAKERQRLLSDGLHPNDLPMLFHSRALGCLPLPLLMPPDAEEAVLMASNAIAFRAMVWRLVGDRNSIAFSDDTAANAWLDWGKQHAGGASSNEWANVACSLLVA